MKRLLRYIFAIVLAVGFTACDNGNYVNSIPKNSVAILSMDIGDMNGVGGGALLKTLLHLTNIKTSGIDVSCPVYLFETENGEIGLCAKITNQDDLEKAIEKMGKSKPLQDFHGYRFTLYKDAWAVGCSDETFLVMGPIAKASYPSIRRQMVYYLSNDEKSGITTSRLYQKMDSIDSPMKMVARVDALPEEFMLPFMLGTPKDTDPSQVCVSAKMNVLDGVLVMDGESFSFNKRVDASLKEAAHVYRPIEGQMVSALPSEMLGGLFINVKGDSLMPLMRENRGFQAMLAGMNTQVDMDSIVKSVDGDFCVLVPTVNEQPPLVRYSDGTTFRQIDGKGVSSVYTLSTDAASTDLRKAVVGKKMVLLINLNLLKGIINR